MELAEHRLPGLWTEADLDALPDDGNRYEILDGCLHVTPPPNGYHQLKGDRLRTALEQAAPKGWYVLTGIGVRLPGGSNFIPDITVLRPDVDLKAVWQEGSSVALVVEVASPSTRTYDRSAKALKYAEAGIGAYWRVAPNAAITIHSGPVDGEYTRTRICPPDSELAVSDPFAVTFIPATLFA